MYLIAVLGFDERHVIRSLLRLGFKNVDVIYLVVPSGRITKQTEEAIKRITEVAKLANVSDVKVFEVDPLGFGSAVAKLRKLIIDLCSGGKDLVISLGGGMRVLIVETLVASLLVPKELSSHILVVVDLESGEGYIEVNISSILTISELKLDELQVLKYLLTKAPAGPTEISKTLGIPKTTVWKILKKLHAKELVTKQYREYKASDTGGRLKELLMELLR
ncbi:MAG: CRISPR-associated CARF protein Csa3 [Thaumarchaeota archaeon]|jgi:CRISPR locus-related DNA-binding protein|nr:CRISPR-associated CARF protein Csa3 [Candidatus Geocrenenecus arthurdayi]